MQASPMELVLFREEDNQQHHPGAVVKRKRTKRPRHHKPASSSASSSESTTTEEEDMAHCLILLAQGGTVDSKPSPAQSQPQAKQLPAPAASPAVAMKAERYTSRKYTEAATTADGVRAGFYVYECKTCNKCFPTFQALGGHRASHKKPRLAGGDEENNSNGAIATNISIITKPKTASPLQPPRPQVIDAAVPAPDVTTMLSLHNGAAGIGSSNRLRVHECSICGAEFASGQALGGHMRRHRPLHAPERAVTAITTDTKREGSTGINLELDLNLPAPSGEDSVSLPPPQPPVVLGLGSFDDDKKGRLMLTASAALVDCHY